MLLLVNVGLLSRCESYIKGISLLSKQRERLEHWISDVLFFVVMDLYILVFFWRYTSRVLSYNYVVFSKMLIAE